MLQELFVLSKQELQNLNNPVYQVAEQEVRREQSNYYYHHHHHHHHTNSEQVSVSSSTNGGSNMESMSLGERRIFFCAITSLFFLFLFGLVSGISTGIHSPSSSTTPTTATNIGLSALSLQSSVEEPVVSGWAISLRPFLPGLSPTQYSMFQAVPMKVTSLRSPELHPNEPLLYYDLPMCTPAEGIHNAMESIWEQSTGEIIQNSPYRLYLGVNLPDRHMQDRLDRELELEKMKEEGSAERELRRRSKLRSKRAHPSPLPLPDSISNNSHEDNNDEEGVKWVRSDCIQLCSLEYDREQVEFLSQKVEEEYRIHFTLDNLPNILPIEMSSKDGLRKVTEYELGMPLGRKLKKEERKSTKAQVCLHSAIAIDVDIYEVSAPNVSSEYPKGAYRIVGFRVQPLQCTPLVEGVMHHWQYSVHWHKSSVSWGSRWDVYSRPNREISNVQYLSLGLYLGMFVLISFGTLFTMNSKARNQLISVLRRKVSSAGGNFMSLLSREHLRPKAVKEIPLADLSVTVVEEGGGDPSVDPGELVGEVSRPRPVEDEAEKTDGLMVEVELADNETVWKALGSSIFIPPERAELFAALIGIGTQLFLSVGLTLVVGVLVLAYETQRGLALQFMSMAYLALSVIGGCAAGIIYRSMRRDGHGRVVALLVLPYATFVFGALTVLNVVLYYVGSSAAIPFWLLALFSAAWTLGGAILSTAGYGLASFCGSCATCVSCSCFSPSIPTQTIARQIPGSLGWWWKAHAWRFLFSTGVFAAISMPLYYLFSSMWGHLFYTAYGVLLLTAFTAALLTSVSTQCFIWTQLTTAEDWRWWWSAWFTAAAPSIHFFVFSVGYYLVSHIQGGTAAFLYFTYVLLLTVSLALLLGAIGVWCCFLSLTWLYRLEKHE